MKKYFFTPAASAAVMRALKDGTLERPDLCESCGEALPLLGHHHLGYAPEHWLHVRWLCGDCHRMVHKRKARIEVDVSTVSPEFARLADARLSLDDVAQAYYDALMLEFGGNKSAVSRVMGVDRKTLYRRFGNR